MHVRTRHRRPLAATVALSVALALPVLATAGPAAAATPATRPAAAPSNNALAVLSDLLARLLPALAPNTVPGTPPAANAGVTASTVRVSGTACGFRLTGSGFAAAPDTVVTNAHVVAGTANTTVLRPDGKTLPAQVQVFDPDRDLAVLAVPGLGEAPLSLAPATVGETDAIYGHPEGQAAVDVSPAQVVRRVNVDLGDIYGGAAGQHQILVLNANLQPGHSGSPVVNSAGKVVGVAFAVANLRRSTAFAVASEEVTPVLAQPRNGPVSTGPCIEE